MKRKKMMGYCLMSLCCLLGTFTALVTAAAVSVAEVEDGIVAVVNDRIITYSELKQFLNPLYAKYERTYSGEELLRVMEQAEHDALEQLIARELILHEAKTYEIIVREGDIDNHLHQIKSQFSSEEEFEETLKKEGATLEELRKKIEEDIMVRRMLMHKLRSKVVVTPQEIREYYYSHRNEFFESEMMRIGHIWIKTDTDNNEEARAKAEEVLQLLRSDESFELLAKNYSDGPNALQGGDMGFFKKGDMLKELEDAAFLLEVGKFSDIITTHLGYHIILLKARKKPRTQSLSESWEYIEKKLFRDKTEAMRADWIDELKDKAYIEIFQ